jgi:hypothetical protein
MAADSQDVPRHAGQVVRRVLLRRNIAVDAETAQRLGPGTATALCPVASLPGHVLDPAPAKVLDQSG